MDVVRPLLISRTPMLLLLFFFLLLLLLLMLLLEGAKPLREVHDFVLLLPQLPLQPRVLLGQCLLLFRLLCVVVFRCPCFIVVVVSVCVCVWWLSPLLRLQGQHTHTHTTKRQDGAGQHGQTLPAWGDSSLCVLHSI